MDNARIKAMKKAIKEIIRGTEEEVEKWWETPHPFLRDKKPSELVKTAEGMRKMEIMVSFSLKGCE